METKTCSKCKCEKPLDAFGAARKSSDGKKSRCKTCNAEDAKEWRLNNPEKYLAKLAKQATDPKRLEYLREYRRKYRKSPAGRAYKAEYRSKSCAELKDNYVKRVICQNTNIPYDQVPRGLVELKKLHLAIKRKLKDEQHHRPA